MRATYGVEEVHPCGKEHICSVTGNLPLKNCVTHIICHILEGKFFCASRTGHFYTF